MAIFLVCGFLIILFYIPGYPTTELSTLEDINLNFTIDSVKFKFDCNVIPGRDYIIEGDHFTCVLYSLNENKIDSSIFQISIREVRKRTQISDNAIRGTFPSEDNKSISYWLQLNQSGEYKLKLIKGNSVNILNFSVYSEDVLNRVLDRENNSKWQFIAALFSWPIALYSIKNLITKSNE